MTNMNSGAALKGSRSYLQHCIDNSEDKLSQMILAVSPSLLSYIDDKSKIEWKSPLKKDDFYEYRDDFLKVLGLDEATYVEKMKKLREFWPKNGPQWDGLAVVNGNNGEVGLLLVEAKAHLNEIKADLRAGSQISIDLIKGSMKIAQEHYGIDDVDWTKHYYQLGNRIAFLYFMNEILHIPTWLVLINFAEGDYKTTSIEQWLTHYHKVYVQMGIKHNDDRLLNKVIQIFPNV